VGQTARDDRCKVGKKSLKNYLEQNIFYYPKKYLSLEAKTRGKKSTKMAIFKAEIALTEYRIFSQRNFLTEIPSNCSSIPPPKKKSRFQPIKIQ